MKVGIIGIGIMGLPMAKNLVDTGNKVYVYDVSETALENAKEFGAIPASYKEIADNCNYIILSLPNFKVIEMTFDNVSGIYKYLHEGTIICDTSSITPTQSKIIYDKLKKINVGYIDSPVSGGEEGAISGNLAIMCGGDSKDFEKASELFDIIGKSKTLVGGSGSGSAAKLVNQVIVNMNIATISEAFVMAKKLGVDPQKVYEAIRGGLAGSRVLDDKMHRIIERDFEPGGSITINFKDINNVVDSASDVNCPVPFTSQLQQIMRSLVSNGKENLDHSGIVTYFENIANTEV